MRRGLLPAWVVAAGLALVAAGDRASAQPSDAPVVVVTEVSAEITPVIADQLCEGVDRAADREAEAYVVQLDTPGGLDTAMRDIVSCFLEATTPVVVHVAPRGARAASAGAVIALASHVAAMAPGTAIGAATPVGLDGSDLSDKVLNDAAALAESVAEARGRSVDFARDMVRTGRSVPASEALALGAVELDSADLEELMADLDGREVELPGGAVADLATADATVERFDLSLFRQILQWLANPNVTFLLLSIGSVAIIYELANPGIGAGGVIGVIAIVIALFSLSVLPVDAVGVMLLFLAIALFVGELFVPGVGILAALGTASLAASALFLFDRGVGARVSTEVWVPVAFVAGLAVVVAGRLVYRVRSQAPAHRIVGATLDPDRVDVERSQAFVEGAWWRAERSDGRPLDRDETLEVVEIRDLTLVVAPAREPPAAGHPNQEEQT